MTSLSGGCHGGGFQTLPAPLHSTRDQPPLASLLAHAPTPQTVGGGVGPAWLGSEAMDMPSTSAVAWVSLQTDSKGTILGNREIYHLKGTALPLVDAIIS